MGLDRLQKGSYLIAIPEGIYFTLANTSFPHKDNAVPSHQLEKASCLRRLCRRFCLQYDLVLQIDRLFAIDILLKSRTTSN